MEKIIDYTTEKQAETIIGSSVKIKGDLDSEGNIWIEGQITGKVSSRQGVFIEKGAKLVAVIAANEASIAGEVQGKLEISGHLILQATARVSGEITCPVLRVEDGATILGNISITGSAKVAEE
jgi:cytoskeletal protein CcmA (bactofilin family)